MVCWNLSTIFFLFQRKNKRKRFILSDKLHPQTIACVQTRALPIGINIEVGNVCDFDFSKKDISGIIFQYPDTEGSIMDFTKVVDKAHKFGVRNLHYNSKFYMTYIVEFAYIILLTITSQNLYRHSLFAQVTCWH